MENNYITAQDYKPCVFQVPDDLRETKPNAYIPQMVGLGPYHHFRPEVQIIGSKKRGATEDCLKENKVEAEFIDLVRNRTPELEHKIRSYYDRYLDLEKETLAWVVIVDGIYLVRFIDDYLKYPEEEKHKVHPNVGSLVEDVFKLENQIPYGLLVELAGIIAPNTLLSVMNKFFINFFSFCDEHMPLCFGGDPHKFFYYQDQCDHLLHFVYELIVNNKRENYVDHGKSEEKGKYDHGKSEEERRKDEYDHGKSEGEGKGYRDWLRSRLAEFADFSSEILEQAIHEFNSALTYGTNAGLKIPGNVEKVSQILNHVEKTLQSFHKKESFSGDKIEIPSASRLFAIRRIKFKALPPDCGIGNISLDKDKKIFYLPVIWMEESSEVILRNLVAYEATKLSKMQQGLTKITDYVDLMCGLIRAEKDVKLLREKKIIEGELSDQEIVRICNGMKKSDAKPDENSNIRRAVKNANDQFNNDRIVMLSRRIMKVIAHVWQVLKALFPALVLLFLVLQSTCTIFDCRRRPGGGGIAAMRDYSLGIDPQAKLMLPRKLLARY